jgi:hypothetical protein
MQAQSGRDFSISQWIRAAKGHQAGPDLCLQTLCGPGTLGKRSVRNHLESVWVSASHVLCPTL